MSKVSLRYARALATAIGDDAKKLETATKELDVAAEVLCVEKFQNFFDNPRVDNDGKEKSIIKSFAHFSKEVLHLLTLINRNGKVGEIAAIAKKFHEVVTESAGFTTARIESTTKLNSKQLEKLAAGLKKMSGKEITLTTSENPALLGGVKITIGNDEVIDLSLSGRLQQLSKVLAT